jgi:hypothetical protein
MRRLSTLRTASPGSCRRAIVAVALALKASYFLLAWGASFYQPIPKYVTVAHPIDPLSWDLRDPLAAHWILNHGDSEYYQAIAEQGYPRLSPEVIARRYTVYAFWPLYPALLAAGLKLTGWPFAAVGLVLSVILSLGGFLLFFELARRWFRGESYPALLATVVLMTFPFAFFYSVFYTEALFLLLSVLGFLLAERRQWLGVALTVALLALTRSNGIVVAFAIGIRCLETAGVTFQRWPTRRQVLPFLAVATAPLALGGYLLFLHDRTGDYFAFSTAQTAWDRHSTWPWEPLVFSPNHVFRTLQSVYVLLIGALAVVGLRRYPLSMQLMVGLCLVLPLTTGRIEGVGRYASALFPLFLVLGGWLLPRPRHGWWVAGLLALHWLSFLPFLHFHHSSG